MVTSVQCKIYNSSNENLDWHKLPKHESSTTSWQTAHKHDSYLDKL